MLASGRVINSIILPKNDSSSRHLFPLPPRLDITFHFTLEVVHELMQQQQTAQSSSKTYLTMSNNNKNLKHPPISYPFNSTIQHFNDTRWDVQKELETRELQWTKYYTQMNLAVFNPIIWSEYFSRYCPSTKIIITRLRLRCFCCILTIFIKVNQLNKPQCLGTNTVVFTPRFCLWSAHLHDTQTLLWKPIS